jgi:hypothetical protein
MPKAKKQPSLNKIMRLAGQLGPLLAAVSTATNRYDERINGKSSAIRSIHAALELIAKTPNATVNRDALDEWADQVIKARRDLKSWLKDYLSPEATDNDDLTGEEIPY